MSQMRAIVLPATRKKLELRERRVPEPAAGQVLIRVAACGVCRTDVHLVDGELPEAKVPVVPGHQIVGRVEVAGAGVSRFRAGDRAGVPWLGWACGECRWCRSGRENLCDRARFTGCTVDGGFADYALAESAFALPLPDRFDDEEAAPLLCAGLIGFRSYRIAGEAERLGFYGFGSSAHILIQLAVAEGRKAFVFTRRGDREGQQFARELGAEWVGSSDERPPEELDAAIIFAPVGALVPAALRAVAKGGSVVCAGIHMSDIPAFPYEILWGERAVRSVANLTRADGEDFFRRIANVPIRVETQRFALESANEAMDAIRSGTVRGSVVLTFGRAAQVKPSR
jgi:alcohol dehydrogenase, propanol-preferring